MKPIELKQEYVRLRAGGKSYSYIAEQLHIGKSTCTAWEKELGAEIARFKQEELNALYESYHMTKADRIRRIGDTLEKIDGALNRVDLTQVAPEKLLDYKLKYTEALKCEYVSTSQPFDFRDGVNAKEISKALEDLLNRVRNGEITTEQAREESQVLSTLLKAYSSVDLEAKLETLEAIVGGIQYA